MPSRLFLSSGDLMADRRFDFARDLQLKGDLAAAADLLLQAIELAPDFASAWFTLGAIREQLGEREAATAAFRRAQAADPTDRHGASLRLMLSGAEPLSGMPPAYARLLFDQYASKFEASLVGDLGYRGPALLFKAVLAARAALGLPPAFDRVIDLGCGTGLAARAFAAVAGEIIGIDLSPRMIERARLTGLLRRTRGRRDRARPGPTTGRQRRSDPCCRRDGLCADMAPLLAEVARVLAPGGCSRLRSKAIRAKAWCSAKGCATPTARPAASAIASRRPPLDAAGTGIVPHRERCQVPGLVVVGGEALIVGDFSPVARNAVCAGTGRQCAARYCLTWRNVDQCAIKNNEVREKQQ